jgi:hypothetical protein
MLIYALAVNARSEHVQQLASRGVLFFKSRPFKKPDARSIWFKQHDRNTRLLNNFPMLFLVTTQTVNWFSEHASCTRLLNNFPMLFRVTTRTVNDSQSPPSCFDFLTYVFKISVDFDSPLKTRQCARAVGKSQACALMCHHFWHVRHQSTIESQ